MTAEAHHVPAPRSYDAQPRGQSSPAPSSPVVHRLALLTAIATFPLIFMGGLVTSHHAGMSVPDWPNSYGYNMFLFPPSHWVGGILYEHTHRLMGTVVGMLAIALAGWSWRREFRNLFARFLPSLAPAPHPVEPHRYLALAVLVAVIFQGVLGGLRVTLVKLDLAIVHACVAQAFFCLAAFAAVVTSRWWIQAPDLSMSGKGRSLVILGAITVDVIFLQLTFGAMMRHFDAGLAIPDLPLAYGKLLPPSSAAGLAAVNHLRAYQLNLDPVTLTQLWLHFGHRAGAVLVSALVIAFATKSLLRRDARGLAAPAVILLVLLVVQLTLGTLTVLLRKPADVASTHVAVGALVLVTSFVMMVRAGRMYGWRAVARVPNSSTQERVSQAWSVQ